MKKFMLMVLMLSLVISCYAATKNVIGFTKNGPVAPPPPPARVVVISNVSPPIVSLGATPGGMLVLNVTGSGFLNGPVRLQGPSVAIGNGTTADGMNMIATIDINTLPFGAYTFWIDDIELGGQPYATQINIMP